MFICVRPFSIAFAVGMSSLAMLLSPGASAQTTAATSADYYNQLLKTTTSDQDLVNVGDMQVRAGIVRAWRDKLAGKSTRSATPQSAVPAAFTKWTGGKVYYTFDAAVSSAHRRAFLDAATEWSTFANVQFLQRTTQANYMLVRNSAFAGGQSAVGMVGPLQLFDIGSWNRGTLLHELGHTLGLIHEHQRSDRDTYVNILAANIPGGATNGNFTLIPTSTNNGAYDFYSVMHYSRNSLSIDPASLNTIEPKPAYAAFLNIYGQQGDRPLSPADRAGMASLYGAGPVLSSIVTNTKDSGPGSLRTALYYAFDNPGTTITFNIPTTDPGYSGKYFVIRPTGMLFSPGNNTIINGTSQPGIASTIKGIYLVGNLMPQPEFYDPGLTLRGSNITVRGLAMSRFPGYGILIKSTSATGNQVLGCNVGTDAGGGTASPNAFDGIAILEGAKNNRIGGSTSTDRNTISGNSGNGIYISGAGTTGNMVTGNFIGTRSTGNVALPNGYSGIEINNASNSTIGGDTSGQRNIISGNTYHGVSITGAGSTLNTVKGNFIGLANTGLAALRNGYAGVQISNGANANTIGGSATTARNTISGNRYQGVFIVDPNTSGNIISANYIGLNFSATNVIGNQASGIEIGGGATNNQIGGTTTSARNFIGGNSYQGISINGSGTNGNSVVGNFIGVGTNGTSPRPNNVGVEIYGGAAGNTIGGAAAGSRNVISGNNYRGVGLSGGGTSNNRVSQNYIGLSLTGSAAVPNVGAGVAVFGGATANIIGGTSSAERNIISGNTNHGITLGDPDTSGNTIEYNFIGLNSSGTAAIGNAWSGIDVFNARSNFIGKPSYPNVISGNGNYGISLGGTNSSGNLIANNIIGLSANSSVSIGNQWSGIAFYDGAHDNRIGGLNSGEGNSISGNLLRGIDLFDTAGAGNRVVRNAIFNNSQLAINLFGGVEDFFGVTANDTGDADTGPNQLQNFPVLTSVISGATQTTFSGTLNSLPNKSYRIDLYRGPSGDASQHGGCRYFLGYTTVVTDATGNGSFSGYFTTAYPVGDQVSATATDPSLNTSEYSLNVTIGN